MMKRIQVWIGLLTLTLLTACAHPITLGSDVTKLNGKGGPKIDQKVGLLLTEEQRNLQVTTPGGGGDKVSYQPYRDLETGLYVALSESFAGVTKLTSAADPKLTSENLRYVVKPTIATTSSSPSPFTWPPTAFTVELTCKITDAKDQLVTEVKVLGEGKAEFDEFKADHSLSARRASEDALTKLMKAIAAVADKLR